MHRQEFLKQLSDALTNDKDVKKVKITYKNGEALKIDFDDDDDVDDVVVEEVISNEPKVTINTAKRVGQKINIINH